MTPKEPTPQGNATDRARSQRQATENADAARDTRRSSAPGADDDSEVIQGWVAGLAAPVEGAADALREDERSRVRNASSSPGTDDVTGPRSEDAPNATAGGERRAKPPTRPEDAESDPLDNTAEHRSTD